MKKLSILTIASLLSFVAAQAQITTSNWTGGADDGGLWGTSGNWSAGVPDGNDFIAQNALNAAVSIDVDGSYTINSFIDGFSGADFTTTLGGAGNLTIDRNLASTSLGINNATGNAGGTLRFTGNIAINNSLGGTTTIRNSNGSGNVMLFDTGSILTITTLLQTVQAPAVGSIQMNGTLAASGANLVIGSSNVSFGTGHNSTSFGKDIVLNANSKLAVDGGTVLNTGRKFQVNGAGELELNGADAINGANVVVGGSNSLLLDVNANQANMGFINFSNNGVLTIDLDPTVTLLSFLDSSAQDWLSGSISIGGFQENVIRFGTDASGLTLDQLAAIDGGAYSLDGSGFLTTVPEPSTYAMISGVLAIAFIMIRRRKND